MPSPIIPDGDVDALAVVGSFLVYAERESPRMMFGSHRVDEAIEAFAHLIGITADKLRTLGR